MLSFQMPSKSEEKRRSRFEEALKASGISAQEEKIFLDIEEGEILRRVHDVLGFENLQREISLGCVAKVPSMRCKHSHRGNRLSYVRMLNADAARNGLYRKGIPVIGKITAAMSSPESYSESLSVRGEGGSAVIQSENSGWCLKVNGNEVIDNARDRDYLGSTVDLLLGFYQSKQPLNSLLK